MSLTINQIKKFHDKGYEYSQTTRRRASNDLVFTYLTQWDDNSLQETQLSYRGEFDIQRKAIRRILSDLAANPVQVDFEPVDENRDDAGDVLDGIYRADNNNNMSIEARANATQEMVVCGYGAWELFAEYASIRSKDNNQVIRRRPIPEANNTVFFDPDSNLMDKSNANWCSILSAYSEDGYKALVEDLTGEEPEDIDPSTFKFPEHSYVFPWVGSGSVTTYYISTFYHRELVETKVFTLLSPVGDEIQVYEKDLDGVMDDYIDQGYSMEGEKTIKRWQITKYIVDGKEILNGEMGTTEDEDGNQIDEERQGEIIVGENIPVVPVYGEYAIIEGETHWEGVTRLAKDPQRLHNFQMSYLADIVSKSPRQKPIFYQEQIAGFEDYYAITGADNNFAYLLQNRLTENGEPLPLGPVGLSPEQPIPQALIASIGLTREAVLDVASSGVPKEISDVDLSNKAILTLNNKIDQQGMVYQDHVKHAERRDGEIYASMASETYDVPRTVSIVMPDGTRKKTKVMDKVFNPETGEVKTLNDINNVEFQVYSTIGPSFNSQKEQSIDRLQTMLQYMAPTDPMREMVMLKIMELTGGVDMKDMREHSRRKQIGLGIKKPETEEDMKILEQAQQQAQQPTAEMLLAMGENKKGDAALLEQKRKGIEMQLLFQNKNTANEIDGFEAQTGRLEAQIKAEEAGANIDNTKSDTFGKQIENSANLKELIVPVSELTDDELMAELTG